MGECFEFSIGIICILIVIFHSSFKKYYLFNSDNIIIVNDNNSYQCLKHLYEVEYEKNNPSYLKEIEIHILIFKNIDMKKNYSLEYNNIQHYININKKKYFYLTNKINIPIFQTIYYKKGYKILVNFSK